MHIKGKLKQIKISLKKYKDSFVLALKNLSHARKKKLVEKSLQKFYFLRNF